jgi:hypothetical protein
MTNDVIDHLGAHGTYRPFPPEDYGVTAEDYNSTRDPCLTLGDLHRMPGG